MNTRCTYLFAILKMLAKSDPGFRILNYSPVSFNARYFFTEKKINIRKANSTSRYLRVQKTKQEMDLCTYNLHANGNPHVSNTSFFCPKNISSLFLAYKNTYNNFILNLD